MHLVDIWNIIEAFRENGLNTLDPGTDVKVIFYRINYGKYIYLFSLNMHYVNAYFNNNFFIVEIDIIKYFNHEA